MADFERGRAGLKKWTSKGQRQQLEIVVPEFGRKNHVNIDGITV